MCITDSPLAAFSGNTMLCGQLRHRNDRWAHVSAFDPWTPQALAATQIADACICTPIHPDRSRPGSLCTTHDAHADDDSAVHADKSHDHTTDSLWFCSLDRYARMDTLYCGMHWIVNRSSIQAFWSYRIRAGIRIDRPFCRDHAASAYTLSSGHRVYDEMDTPHPVDIPNHRSYWKIDTQPLLILKTQQIQDIHAWNTFVVWKTYKILIINIRMALVRPSNRTQFNWDWTVPGGSNNNTQPNLWIQTSIITSKLTYTYCPYPGRAMVMSRIVHWDRAQFWIQCAVHSQLWTPFCWNRLHFKIIKLKFRFIFRRTVCIYDFGSWTQTASVIDCVDCDVYIQTIHVKQEAQFSASALQAGFILTFAMYVYARVLYWTNVRVVRMYRHECVCNNVSQTELNRNAPYNELHYAVAKFIKRNIFLLGLVDKVEYFHCMIERFAFNEYAFWAQCIHAAYILALEKN